MHSIGRAFVCVALLASGIPGCGDESPAPLEPAGPAPLSGELVSNCQSWPEQDFSKDTMTTIRTLMAVGDAAADFELLDLSGNPVRLSTLLRTRPVLLVLGSTTCPRYQENLPVLNELVNQPYDDSSTFGERFHFVHVYIVEAHPKAPDASPYSGVVSELFYSDVRQSHTYADRKAIAERIGSRLQGPQTMLVDGLDPDGIVNPVWCTYGTAPNATYIIDQEGLVRMALNYAFGTILERDMRAVLDELDAPTP